MQKVYALHSNSPIANDSSLVLVSGALGTLKEKPIVHSEMSWEHFTEAQFYKSKGVCPKVRAADSAIG